MRTARTLAIVAVLLGLVAAVARPDSSAASPTTVEAAQRQVAGFWVGAVRGTDIFLAIKVEKDGRVVAYVCDGTPRKRATNYGWFLGRSIGNRIDVRANGMRLRADLTSGWAKGTLTLASGKVYRFDAKPARGHAGVYWLEGNRGFAWVVLADRRVRGGGKRDSLAQACDRLVAQIKAQEVKVASLGGTATTAGQNAQEDLELYVSLFLDFCT